MNETKMTYIDAKEIILDAMKHYANNAYLKVPWFQVGDRKFWLKTQAIYVGANSFNNARSLCSDMKKVAVLGTDGIVKYFEDNKHFNT